MVSVVLTLGTAVLLAVPLGLWMKKVMNGEITSINRQEQRILDFLKISGNEMSWKKYFACLAMLSLFCFLLLFVLLLADGLSWDLALNTAVSFITNTDWQASNPAGLSWLTWSVGIGVSMFLSAGAGLCTAFALLRGFSNVRQNTVGNFWKDILGSVCCILLPLNVVLALFLAAAGVPMNFSESQASALIEPVAVDAGGNLLDQAVIEDGKVYTDGVEDPQAQIVTEQLIPAGPMAALEAIKSSGTNGGGMTAASSASPFENPNGWSGLMENVSILLIPMALCFSCGSMLKSRKQGRTLFAAMSILFAVGLVCCLVPELQAQNMLGKESRFGIEASSLWTVSATAASSGSVNSSLTGYTPSGSLVPMILMQIGEVVYGGVGTGLTGMIGFVILTVFIAGLMVGRTPEFMGKKIEPKEMKNAAVLCICAPCLILIGSALSCLFPPENLAAGPHGFSQILYAWSSMGANNGSAMGGFAADGLLMNVLGAVIMALGRFVPIWCVLNMAGSLAVKKRTPVSAGTLASDTPLFTFLLIAVVLLVGALSFFPALALGPLAQLFG